MNNFPMIFSSSVCFLFAITNGMVKVLMEGCFGSDLFDLTNISYSFSCFRATWREKLENDSLFPMYNFPSEHSLHSAYIVSLIFLVGTLQLVQLYCIAEFTADIRHALCLSKHRVASWARKFPKLTKSKSSASYPLTSGLHPVT